MKKQERKNLDLSLLNFKREPVSSECALADVVPFEWSEKVINGDRKLIVSKQKQES